MEPERKPALRAAPAHTVQYERRRPEQTLLHRLVREHLETFLAQVEARTGTGLPAFVRDEFEGFLECGILAHGFLRVRCVDCAHEKLVAFSCKRRGFCPSCVARRMAQSAAVLVDEVIPQVPVRQWVLSTDLREAALRALSIPPRVARAHAEGFSWDNVSRTFFGHLAPISRAPVVSHAAAA